MNYPALFLKKHEDKRLRLGHLWVFSNEVDIQRSPLNSFIPGQLVNVVGHDGKALGTAYINPNTLVCARLLSRKSDVLCNSQFFKTRLLQALTLRQALFDKPYYRLVFGESDGLPGLVIDRFGDILVLQITTAGMEAYKALLLSVLIDLFNPLGIILKNDNSQRELEGLQTESEIAYGECPTPLLIEENEARYQVDIFNGQKTGWFYDHRNHRRQLANLASDKRVLDLFCYTGAWGIPAALKGAASVVGVDASESALAIAAKNAQLNGIAERMQFVRSDVFEFLKQARAEQERYEVIVLDPPALVKRKKDFKAGYEAYRRLNDLALQVLAPGGILVSASCSYHLSADNLHELIRSSARHIDRHLIFFNQGSQGPDHPVHPSVPETCYLKTFFCYVSPSL